MRQKFASNSLRFTLLSLAASALNFAYYPVISRFLDLAQFGDIQIGLSFVMQAAALFSSLNLVALFLSSNMQTAENLTSRLERIIIVPSIVVSILIGLFAIPISKTLQLHDPSLLYLLVIIFILNIPASTWLGTLQGEGSFVRSGWIALAASLLKILSSILLVLCGFGSHGAIIGIIIGTLAIIPLCFLAQKTKQLHIKNTFQLASKLDLRYLLGHKMIILMLITFTLLSLVSTFDVLFAKITLHPIDAGIFSQLSTVAKIPYFLLLPISIILFGKFITDKNNQGKIMALYCIGAALLSFVVFLAAEPLCLILFRLTINQESLVVLGSLVTAFYAFTVSNLAVYVLISKNVIKTAFTLTVMCFIGTAILLFFSSGESSIAVRFAIAQIITSLLLISAIGYTKK